MAVTPGQVNFLCPQGSTFSKRLTYTIEDVPVDLTGYTARMQVRQNHFSPDTIADLFSPNGGITVGGSAGTIDLFIDDEETSSYPPGQMVYDLELISSGGDVSRLVEGLFIVSPEVTR